MVSTSSEGPWVGPGGAGPHGPEAAGAPAPRVDRGGGAVYSVGRWSRNNFCTVTFWILAPEASALRNARA